MKLFTAVSLMLSSVLLPGSIWAQNTSSTDQGVKETTLMQVSGHVKDAENDQPLAGVTITDNGKKVLGTSNANGSFSISVQKGKVLVFSTVSFSAQRFTVDTDNRNLTISLVRDARQLDNVVVTALGIKRSERALGYSTTIVKGEELTDARSANWTDALSGKVAGLNLVRSNSGPAGSNKIILRGENNLTGNNEALVVVDGVVINRSSGRRNAIAGEAIYGTGSDNMPADYGSSINDINQEDIESVNILKGPGAAALYGQDAANGAIIITTKAGTSRKKGLGITFNSNVSIEEVNRWPDLQFEYGQGLDGAAYYSYGASSDGASTSGTSSAYGPRFEGQMFYQYDPVTQAQGKERTPWVPYKNKLRNYFNT
ncbi:MAG TPA: TonB-dependent receptor plug domain-containing protein, partial [Flavisolibacter sp.]|nr:TonB-dependent receptor plug domain-containing protein [Flavisolibacter sp.]